MEKLRRTMMFIPGASTAMLEDAPLYGADSIMFDLEDAVSLKERDVARTFVHSALRTIDYGNIKTVVRINALEQSGEGDIKAVVSTGVDVTKLPKTETTQEIIVVDKVITKAEGIFDCTVGTTKMMAAIGSAEDALNSREVVQASPRIVGIAPGAGDYVANMKTKRYLNGQELFFIQSVILHAARTAGIAAIDTACSDVENVAGFQAETAFIKQLGFDGKSVINPRQIPVVREIYAPAEADIQHAKEVIWAIEETDSRGSGVISLNGKMVDRPIVEHTERAIALAKATDLLGEEE